MNEMDAEDVTQEVLLSVCKNIGALREPKAFGKWLSSIITHEANRYAKIKNNKGFMLDIDEYTESVLEKNIDFLPEENIDNQELRAFMMDIISGLPTRQRQAIMLFYYDELSVTEVAETMGITHQNASKYLALGHEKIKIELQKETTPAYFGVIAALTSEPVLSEIIYAEAINFAPFNEGWMENIMTPCAEYFVASNAATVASTAAVSTAASGAATAVALSTSAKAAIVTAICALAVCAAVVIGVLNTGVPTSDHTPITDEDVIFSGGIASNGNLVHVNPSHVYPTADRGLTVVEWWITAHEDDTILYEGRDEAAMEEALVSLRESGENGIYFIFFRVQTEDERTYTIGGSFYIMT